MNTIANPRTLVNKSSIVDLDFEQGFRTKVLMGIAVIDAEKSLRYFWGMPDTDYVSVTVTELQQRARTLRDFADRLDGIAKTLEERGLDAIAVGSSKAWGRGTDAFIAHLSAAQRAADRLRFSGEGLEKLKESAREHQRRGKS